MRVRGGTRAVGDRYCRDADHRRFAVHTLFTMLDGQGKGSHGTLRAVDGCLTRDEWMSSSVVRQAGEKAMCVLLRCVAWHSVVVVVVTVTV